MRARHCLFAAFLTLSLAPSFSAYADLPHPKEGENEHSENAREQRAVAAHQTPEGRGVPAGAGGGGSDELGSAEGGRRASASPEGGELRREPEESPPGIENWWSWDYGEKTTDPSHKGWPPPFGWALVNFLIFLGVLSKILWAPLKAGFVERHESIKGELAEARRLHQEAEAQLAEFQRKVGNADKEVADLLTQLRKDAENDRARLVAAAETEAKRLKEDADRQIRVEIESARAELRRGAVEAAIAAAEEILKKGVTADDQRRLVERYVGDVEKVAPSTKGAAS